ncbi:DDB1- and CUL4-associated factor 13-like isoform X2 [Cyprinus carpio]|uniref:DDB1- and CUL4-associated factor 13-like isoform X2 n=1 Tax=Cyprinus carpio TaxID=7962 RepID=A0A9Q9XAH8_CYPCA|nr:DDB1- and CUL4-associated factor 13-like isoform X2 [Cyprinus carpio]
MDTEHISCITKHNKSMSTIICGACDGEVEDDKSIKQWNIEAPVHGVREEPINMILGKVYHTKHMQHVICVRWSADNKYVLSGSDEMNIRLWKANASEKLGLVKHIARHLHLPRDVLKQKRELREMKEAWRRKEQNVRKHRKLGFVPLLTEKEKHVVAVMEQELI